MKRKIKELQKDYNHLKKDIERNITKLSLSLEDELMLFTSLDKINKILDNIAKMCYNK
jgi:hypothetical protein